LIPHKFNKYDPPSAYKAASFLYSNPLLPFNLRIVLFDSLLLSQSSSFSNIIRISDGHTLPTNYNTLTQEVIFDYI
jgi:hypothetical protein